MWNHAAASTRPILQAEVDLSYGQGVFTQLPRLPYALAWAAAALSWRAVSIRACEATVESSRPRKGDNETFSGLTILVLLSAAHCGGGHQAQAGSRILAVDNEGYKRAHF
jgi:hypothetical protein